MTLRERIRTFLRPYDMNERLLTPAQVWSRGGIWQPLTGAGIEVTAELAMQSAIGACVRLLADDISALPVDVYRKVDGESIPLPRPPWLDYPTGRRWDTFQAHISDVIVSMLTDGNAFVECVPDTVNPRLMRVHDPEMVRVEQLDDGAVVYRKGDRTYTEMEMAHIPWVRMPGKLRGLSMLAASRDSSGLELAARQWAGAFFANGGTVGTVISHPGRPSAEEVDIMRKSFEERHKGSGSAFKLGIVTGGAKLEDGTIKPMDAALEPLWKHVLEEAARLFHIPPHLLGSQDPGGSSFASVEQRSIEYVQHAIIPVTTRLEAAHGRFLGTGYLKFNVNSLMRGDFQSRMQGYRTLLETRVLSKEAVRALEDLPKDDTEAGYLMTPNNQTRDFKTEDARVLVQAGFDPAAVLSVVGLPPMPHNGLVPVTQLAEEKAGISISDIELRDEAAEKLTQSVNAAIVVGNERAAVDIAQSTTDIISAHSQDIATLRDQMQALQSAIAEQREAERQAALLPIEKRVHRDAQGRLSGVVETQGGTTRRRVIERDESGSVIRIVEAVA